MEYLLNQLRILLRDRKKRGYVLLPLLLLILILVLWFQMATWPEEDPPGAMLWLKCPACEFYGEMRVVDLSKGNYLCPKCKAKLGQLRKCNKCAYEYVDVPKPIVFAKDATKYQRMEQLEDAHKCTNCGATDNYIINEPR